MKDLSVAIIGAGNIGTAIASGLAESGRVKAGNITLSRRRTGLLQKMAERGFKVENDNRAAAKRSRVVIVAVEPQKIDGVLKEIAPELRLPGHILISVVTGITAARLARLAGPKVPVIRAMPNTAIAAREAMTCIAPGNAGDEAVEIARTIFDAVGKTIVISEEQMNAATALGACGVAFFLRAIRAASQGGIEIGFSADEALAIAAQTARGAATLLLSAGNHPEHEIDRVTTPRGCTIAGLNQMEHEGFSSAMIRGITASAERASKLHTGTEGERQGAASSKR